MEQEDLQKITDELLAASRRARLLDARVHNYFDALPDAVIVVDRRGYIDLVNQRAELFTGYDREDLIGQPVEILVPKEFRDQHIKDRDEYMMHPETRPMGVLKNLQCKKKDGSLVPVLIALGVCRVESERFIVASIRTIDGS